MINKKFGMTLVEIIVYAVIFMVIGGFMLNLLWGGKNVETGRKRLGILQDLRISSLKMNRELTQAAEILFPPADGKKYSQLVFLSCEGKLIVIFLDHKKSLNMLNYDDLKKENKKPFLLAQKTLDFYVMRPEDAQDYVQYFIQILDEKEMPFVLIDGISVKNIIR